MTCILPESNHFFIDKIGDNMSVSEVQGEHLASGDQKPPTSKHRRKQREYSWLVSLHFHVCILIDSSIELNVLLKLG